MADLSTYWNVRDAIAKGRTQTDPRYRAGQHIARNGQPLGDGHDWPAETVEGWFDETYASVDAIEKLLKGGA